MGVVLEANLPTIISAYPYTGFLAESILIDEKGLIGHTLAYDVYFVDSKGNKSAVKNKEGDLQSIMKDQTNP